MSEFDTQALTEEGYVLKDPAGNYVAFSERQTHTGDHCEVRPVRLAQAEIFPAMFGPPAHSKRGKAVREYQNHIPDGTLEAIRVVRTTNTTISERPGGHFPPV